MIDWEYTSMLGTLILLAGVFSVVLGLPIMAFIAYATKKKKDYKL